MRRAWLAVLAVVLVAGMVGVADTVAVAAGSPLPVTAVTASGDDGNVPANTLDEDLTTRWSDEGDGVWIQYDLGSAKTVGSVSLAWHKGDARTSSFEVRLSGDGSSWTTALSRRNSSGDTLQLENHDFADRSARYVRVLGYGNPDNDWTSITETTVNGADGGGGGGDCEYPADVLNLQNWYIGLPIGEDESPLNIKQPELETYSIDPWFRATSDCTGVQFRAPVNGVTTSGSNYPRSELREMTDSGENKASWSSTSGTHTMEIDQAITATPEGRPNIVAGQIHDDSDDLSVFRLEGSKLYVTDENEKHTLVTDDYELGTRFRVKFEVSDGKIRAYYNGELKATLSKSFTGGYFKAGAYTQANCDNTEPCSEDNYGEVKIYGLTVTHTNGDDGENPAPGQTVPVDSSSELQNALEDAQAGDRIVLADGEYTIGKMSGRNGTASEPITVVAANRGRAVINDGQLEVLDSSHVTFEGLKWTNSSTLKITSSNNVRLTRNHFRLTEESSLKWVIIQGEDSHHNRIDHNLFEEKHELGNFITIDGSETQQSQHDRIDHNHFRNIGPRAENEMEAIRVGWSEISRSSGFTVIESNLFEHCDGDPEIISVKSNDNIVRYNTFRASQGTLSHRHGNRGTFHGNFFLGEGKEGTGGIRIYGQDHKIYNNHFEGLTGSGYDAALQLDGGDVDTSGALNAHWRVYRATVVNNTFVNNTSNIEIGANYDHPPVDSVIADNVVTGSEGKLFNELMDPENLTYAGNIAWPLGSATVGVSGIRTADPLLTADGSIHRLGDASPAIDAGTGDHAFVTDDMDGQERVDGADVGADEWSSAAATRGPLTAADVGPDAA